MAFNGAELNYLDDGIGRVALQSNNEIFAVVIGIDEHQYVAIDPLQGAVNDAKAIHKVLLDDLHVPPRNIVLLVNAAATRAKIVSAIQTHLRDNPDIQDHGKATKFVYFAGHGRRVEAPKDIIAPDGRIEMLCPVDDRTTNEAGEVHAIPDYVLGRLLEDIADKKGHNNVR
ncbi:hypothetical protein B0H12DRAFT_1011056 [Mycena haematopus]|nr:hypothetical protein B0H12DRAFT_1011056 [Mycena haematopus]